MTDKGNETLNEILDNSVNPDGSGGADSELKGADFNQGGLADSSTAQDKPQVDPDGVNEENTVQDLSEQEQVEKETDPENDQEDPGKDKDLGGQDDRFDKHPRFKELEGKIDSLSSENNRLTGMVQTMKDLFPSQSANEKEVEPDYVDVTGKTDQELQDWFDDNPKGFMANFAKQVTHEVTQQVTSQLQTQDTETKTQTTIQEFAEKNPDFTEKWKSGEIQQLMERYPSGFHNPISAYYELTNGSREKSIQDQVDEAVAKAIKETEEKVTKNFMAKRRIAPMGGGSSAKNSAPDEDLKDTKKSGGLVAALTQRIMNGRQAA